jgi:hypothetical protein
MTDIEKLLKLFDEKTLTRRKNASPIYSSGVERALWHLLERWKEKLPPLNEDFHKTFRQTDVTDNEHIDMAIWHLLQESTWFWEIFDKVVNENKEERP